jgi:hypothetical protein
MAPRDPEPPDQPPRLRDTLGLPSKERREAILAKLRDKRASAEPAGNETPATTEDIGVREESSRPFPEPDLLMLDPSFLFSEDGVTWLREEPRVRTEEIVISSALMGWLRSGDRVEDLMAFVAPEDLDGIDERRAALAELLEVSQTFSWEGVDLEGPDEEVLLALREGGDLAAAALADEWAFLQSHSWALSKLHLPLDAFRDAGAAVLEYGRRLREELVNVVIPQKEAPPALTRRLLAKASAKWLIVGGAGAGGALLGPVGAGIVGSGVAVPIVRAFDP